MSGSKVRDLNPKARGRRWGDVIGPRCRTYCCKGCGRRVPWCYGAADDLSDYCDGCWVVARFAHAIATCNRAASRGR